jgi:hypothetical protein
MTITINTSTFTKEDIETNNKTLYVFNKPSDITSNKENHVWINITSDDKVNKKNIDSCFEHIGKKVKKNNFTKIIFLNGISEKIKSAGDTSGATLFSNKMDALKKKHTQLQRYNDERAVHRATQNINSSDESSEKFTNSSSNNSSSTKKRDERREARREEREKQKQRENKNKLKAKNTAVNIPKKTGLLKLMRKRIIQTESICYACKKSERLLNKDLLDNGTFKITKKRINNLKKAEKLCKNCLKLCKYIKKNKDSKKLRKDHDIFNARFPKICIKDFKGNIRALTIKKDLRKRLLKQYQKINK